MACHWMRKPTQPLYSQEGSVVAGASPTFPVKGPLVVVSTCPCLHGLHGRWCIPTLSVSPLCRTRLPSTCRPTCVRYVVRRPRIRLLLLSRVQLRLVFSAITYDLRVLEGGSAEGRNSNSLFTSLRHYTWDVLPAKHLLLFLEVNR